MYETLSVLSCFSNHLFAGVGLEKSGGEAIASPIWFRCEQLFQCVVIFISANVGETPLFFQF